MKKVIFCLLLSVTFLPGCEKSLPKCSDKEVIDVLKTKSIPFINDKIVDVEEIVTHKDKSTDNALLCTAKFTFGNPKTGSKGLTLPGQYIIQRTDDGKIIIQIPGLN